MRKTFDSHHHAHDVQAIVGSGFAPLRHCTYWLLRIVDSRCAQGWLDLLLRQNLVKSVADLGRETGSRDNTGGVHNEVVMLAVTYLGLARLGLHEHTDYPFPSAFRSGMAHRNAGPATAGDAAAWRWADCPDRGDGALCVDLLAAHYHNDPAAVAASLLQPCTLEQYGLAVVSRVATCPSYIQPVQDHGQPVWHISEPFGFRDSIGQPVIRGLRVREDPPGAASLNTIPPLQDHIVAAGEFVLGHTTEYGEAAYCPDMATAQTPLNGADPPQAFGFNGSYLAVQQIRQQVDAFRAFEQACAAASAQDPSIVEKMLGRRKDGAPLVVIPAGGSPIDAFRYRLEDQEGFQCPRGAHARRANPRDMLGWDTDSGVAAARLHRILRRGRVYAEGPAACESNGSAACGDACHRAGCGKGLFFMALNADLERQFEFVQQRWLEGAHFADLRNETDPIAAAPLPGAFSLQGVPVGRRIEGFAQFTQDVGGGYFFVPSLSALRVMAGAPR
jgi:putative iron-dependent peroxidase